MKDNLEKFILDNREGFDQDVPKSEIWERINQQVNPKPKNRRLMMWKAVGIAASMAILIGFGALIGVHYLAPQSANIAQSDSTPSELVEMEEYYNTQINQKKARLASLNYDGNVSEDLQQLDEFLAELKIELEESPKGAEEQIVEAMINNYQIRIDILERILQHLESNNQEPIKSEDDETTSI